MKNFHSSLLGCVGLCALFGCVSGPALDNPQQFELREGPFDVENPVVVAPRATSDESYRIVFEQILDAIDDYFPIASAKPLSGKIVCKPTIAPGYEQPWRPGSPDFQERLTATTQQMRYRCEVDIRAAEPSGYLIGVVVYKELKDTPVPTLPNTSVAIFNDGATVDRDYQIVEAIAPTANLPSGSRWIPKGRETAIEQKILKKIQRLQWQVNN
jgi:hypothetical protein